MNIIEILKALVFGIVEGFTEWLPISSTGHMILLDELVQLDVTPEFKEVFLVVIQLGAILAVVVLYFSKLFPFTTVRGRGMGRKNLSVPLGGRSGKSVVMTAETYRTARGGVREDIVPLAVPVGKDGGRLGIKVSTLVLWVKVILACLPAAIVGIPLDDWMEEHLRGPYVVAAALIIYGILFIVVENQNYGKRADTEKVEDISLCLALLIGCFQTLSLVPGTSRSGATILGAMILGCSRGAAAEFSFYLGVPVMFGASLLKLIKFGFHFTGGEVFILLFGMAVAFLVSVYSIRFLMTYIRRNDFKLFGYYRIVLGVIVIAYFLVTQFIPQFRAL